MAYDKRRVAGVVGASGSLTTNLASDFAEFVGFRLTSTGDTATRLTLTDGAGKIFYLDAADVDYTTTKDRLVGQDDTITGLSTTSQVDATGAAAAISGGQGIPVQSPIVATWVNGTAGDAITLDLYYRYPLWKESKTLTVPNPAATVSGTVSLRSKFAQILGFKALLTGTSTTTRIKITDADSRVIYLDAADTDYKTAAVNRNIAYDGTNTGLTAVPVDPTGAAATATSSQSPSIAKSPLTIELSLGEVAGDVLAMDLWYRTS